MSIVFLVKHETKTGNSFDKIPDSIYSVYSESRKAAKKIVDELNSRIKKEKKSIEDTELMEFKEVSPDLWSNGRDYISIILFHNKKEQVKNSSTKKKNLSRQNEKKLYSMHLQIA